MDSRMIENLLDLECKLGYGVEAKLPAIRAKYSGKGVEVIKNELVDERNGHWDRAIEALFSPSAHQHRQYQTQFRYYKTFGSMIK